MRITHLFIIRLKCLFIYSIQNELIFCISIAVLILAEFIIFLSIKRIRQKKNMKKLSTEIVLAKISSFKAIPGRPTRYIMRVEFERNHRKQKKCMVTGEKFGKKYEHTEQVQLVVAPESDMVFFAEESWKGINIVLHILFIVIAFMLGIEIFFVLILRFV